jgi:small nuclear ribonucleoprotein (snRNP)-like protein
MLFFRCFPLPESTEINRLTLSAASSRPSRTRVCRSPEGCLLCKTAAEDLSVRSVGDLRPLSLHPSNSYMVLMYIFPCLAVTVELKNDISIRGTLKSVDQYLNIKLDDVVVLEELKYPHLSSVKNIFIRYVETFLSRCLVLVHHDNPSCRAQAALTVCQGLRGEICTPSSQ